MDGVGQSSLLASLKPTLVDRQDLAEELEALAAIFGDGGLTHLSSPDKHIAIGIHTNLPNFEDVPLTLEARIPPDYPDAPPYLTFSSRYLGAFGTDNSALPAQVSRIYDASEDTNLVWFPGQVMLFEGIEKARELAGNYYGEQVNKQVALEREREGARVALEQGQPGKTEETPVIPEREAPVALPPGLTIFSSEPIVDRKSVFVGHATILQDPSQVPIIRAYLLSDRKIARAAHNIIAWRCEKDGRLYRDNDDDGETAAGGRLAHLLHILGVENAFVCVTRWFGGIHLGPDRFKHINQAARNALVLGNLLAPDKASSKTTDKKRRS